MVLNDSSKNQLLYFFSPEGLDPIDTNMLMKNRSNFGQITYFGDFFLYVCIFGHRIHLD